MNMSKQHLAFLFFVVLACSCMTFSMKQKHDFSTSLLDRKKSLVKNKKLKQEYNLFLLRRCKRVLRHLQWKKKVDREHKMMILCHAVGVVEAENLLFVYNNKLYN